MWTFNAISSCVLVVAMGGVLLLILLLKQERTKKDVNVWLLSGLAGVLLGAIGSAAVIELAGGYQAQKQKYIPTAEEIAATLGTPNSPPITGPPGGGQAGPGGGPGAPGGGRGGPGGGRGGRGGRGGFTPPAKFQLASLVRKLELLTGDIQLQLAPEQASALEAELGGIEEAETMTDDQAQEKLDSLMGLLSDEEKAKLDAVGLPFGGFGGRGRGRGPDNPDANPFQDDENAQALQTLRSRLK